MLKRGNSKLGKAFWQWSITAGVTCPGKSHLCDSRCYAQKGFYSMPNVQKSLEKNYSLSRSNKFPEQMINAIRKQKARLVRIHVAGDFYSAEYASKWRAIISASPETRFLAYTRSWRVPSIRKELVNMAKTCPNLRQWWSTDQETGKPKKVPPQVRTCHMSIAAEDTPLPGSSLVFRDYADRNTIQKHKNGVLVCPPENGVTNLTCTQCGYCWRDKTTPVVSTSRISLNVLSPMSKEVNNVRGPQGSVQGD